MKRGARLSLLLLSIGFTMCLYSCEGGGDNGDQATGFSGSVIVRERNKTPTPPRPPRPWRANLDITDVSIRVGQVGKVRLALENTMKEADEAVEATVYIKLNSEDLELVTDKPFPRKVLIAEHYNGMIQMFGIRARKEGVYTCRVILKSLPDAQKVFYVAKNFKVNVRK